MDSGIDNLMHVFASQNKVLKPVETRNVFPMVDQLSSLFAAGFFYYFIFNLVTLEFDYVSEDTKPLLGIESYHLSFRKWLKIIHPQDLEQMCKKESTSINFILNNIPRVDITKYKTVYLLRIKDEHSNYKTFLHQGKVLTVSEDGKIQQTIGVDTDISYLKLTFDQHISFIPLDTKLKSYHFEFLNNEYILIGGVSERFTKREIEIIKLLQQGKRANEIADMLYISLFTVNTHKKNILKKTNSKNSTELVFKCLRDGYI